MIFYTNSWTLPKMLTAWSHTWVKFAPKSYIKNKVCLLTKKWIRTNGEIRTRRYGERHTRMWSVIRQFVYQSLTSNHIGKATDEENWKLEVQMSTAIQKKIPAIVSLIFCILLQSDWLSNQLSLSLGLGSNWVLAGYQGSWLAGWLVVTQL